MDAKTKALVTALLDPKQTQYNETDRYMLVHPTLLLRLLELAQEGAEPEEIVLAYLDAVTTQITLR